MGVVTPNSGVHLALGPAAAEHALVAGGEEYGDPGGAEILVLAELLDESSTPAKVACIVESLEDDGAPLQACTDAGAEHMDLPARRASFALDWATALAREEPAPPCAESDLPACE